MRLPASISKLYLTTIVVLLGALADSRLLAASELETMDSEVTALYDKSKDAVVKVHAESTIRLGQLVLRTNPRAGTGFFIDGQGHLMTSSSVVQDEETCWIEYRDQRVPAKIVGCDPDSRVALLQVDPEKCVGAGHQTPFLPQGDPNLMRIGSMVIAIGFPYDMPSLPVVGFVGGLDIKCGAHTFITSHFRADCKLSPGQGGGPFLNSRGEVVGIAIASHGENQSYGLPINAAMKVCTDIIQGGKPQHGWVGLSVSERRIIPGLPGLNEWQVFIQQVYSNTPAADAGFHDQDVLLQICTNEIHRSADVLNTMFYHHCGEKISFTVLRKGQRQEVTLIVGTRPPAEQLVVLPTQPLPFIREDNPPPPAVPASTK